MSGLEEDYGDERKPGEITEAVEEDKVLLLLCGLSGVTNPKCALLGGGQD